MRSSKRDSPWVLPALVAGLAAAAAWRWLSAQPVSSSELDLSSILPVLAPVAALGLSLLLARVLATRRTLRSRSSLVVVPADQFDPSAEQVMRFASQLTRTRRSVRGWLDPAASAIRVRLESDTDGQLAYLLELPSRSLPLLRSALRTYEGLELRDPAGVVPDSSSPAAGSAVRAELVLARPSVEPLARPELDPDPLLPLASALAELKCERGEHASVCVDLLPVGG